MSLDFKWATPKRKYWIFIFQGSDAPKKLFEKKLEDCSKHIAYYDTCEKPQINSMYLEYQKTIFFAILKAKFWQIEELHQKSEFGMS